MPPSRPAPDPSPDPTSPARRARRPIDGRKVMVRFVGVVTRVPRYMKLGWHLLRDPRVPGRGKAALAGALGYAISPIDPIPGFIPIIGQLDDLAILLLGLRSALGSSPPEVANEHLAAAGVSLDDLERDRTTVRVTAVWVAQRSGAIAARLAKAAVAGVLARLNGGTVEPGVDRTQPADGAELERARHVPSRVESPRRGDGSAGAAPG